MPETPEQLYARAAGALRSLPVHEWDTFPFEGQLAARQLIARVDTAIRAVGEIGRVHTCRWGDGSEHLHWWFMGRPARLPQLLGSFAAIWDDVLPPTPQAVWDSNLERFMSAFARS